MRDWITYILLVTMALTMLFTFTSCDEKDTWASVKPMLTEAVINAALTAKADPEVNKALLSGDYETVKVQGIKVMRDALKNEISTLKLGGKLDKRAYKYLTHNQPLVAAMLARPNDEGLYWRLDRWLKSKGHLEGTGVGLLMIKLSEEEREELYPLVRIAVEEEYVAARAFINENDGEL